MFALRLCFLFAMLPLFASHSHPHLPRPNGKHAGFKVPVHRAPRQSKALPPLPEVLSMDVPVIDSREYAYLVQVNVGGQQFELTLDTGSSDLWLVSTDCTSSDCNMVHKYNQSASSTLSVSSTPFSLAYLLGSVTGYIATDTVRLGPYEVSSQVLGLANQTSNLGLSSTGNSGILGLSFPGTSAIPLTTGMPFLENVFSHFDEGQRFFAFRLGRDAPETINYNPFGTQMRFSSSSSFTIGQLDPTIANDTNGFAFTNLSSTPIQYWSLPIQSININSLVLPLSPSRLPGRSEPLGVLDTGTTLLLGPSADVSTFWATVGSSRKNGNSGMWEVRCERAVTVSITLGEGAGREYFIDPEDISWAQGQSGGGWCMGGMQENNDINSGDWLLGDIFLRNVYVTHHAATSTSPPSVGLLNLTDPVQALSAFRRNRGSDTAPQPSAITNAGAVVGSPGKLMICGLSVLGGFTVGALGVVAILCGRKCVRSKRDRRTRRY